MEDVQRVAVGEVHLVTDLLLERVVVEVTATL
jgi:hypothetical protein